MFRFSILSTVMLLMLGLAGASQMPAQAQASQWNEKIFPPDGRCNPSDPYYDPTKNYLLSWDGASNVQCVQLSPLTCGPGQYITFNDSSLQFSCCTPQTQTLSSTACPAGQQGSIDSVQTTDCSGNTTTAPVNNCARRCRYVRAGRSMAGARGNELPAGT